MTPLILVLMLVESSDVIFAVDSIPAIFGVTRDPFIVFTSNVFAILGLRSLFFVLAGVMVRFRFLNISISLILVFVGAKMILEEHVYVPVWISLAVVCAFLAGGIGASLAARRRESKEDPSAPASRAADAPSSAGESRTSRDP